MATSVLADSPPAPASDPGQPDALAGTPSEPPAGSAGTPEASARSCANCGAAMAPGQDWCLQCGAGAPGSGGSSGWRSAATLLALTAVLALGAAAAAFAALSKEPHKPGTVTMTVAQAVAPVAPATTTTTTPLLSTPSTPSVTTSVPTTAVKPPKIPLAVTPTPIPSKSGTSTAATPTQGSETGTAPKTTPSSTPNTGTASEESQPAALLLDTNAASTYNPYTYPESDFGDPSLTIDGDVTTGWTAVVEPTTAPKMAEGVLIDLKTPHKLSSLVLITTTPGITVQVYGANGATAPTSITDPAWIPLSHSRTIVKKHVRIKLRNQKEAFTFVTLWISKAPASAVGTPAAPGRVSINEIELFPAH